MYGTVRRSLTLCKCVCVCLYTWQCVSVSGLGLVVCGADYVWVWVLSPVGEATLIVCIHLCLFAKTPQQLRTLDSVLCLCA